MIAYNRHSVVGFLWIAAVVVAGLVAGAIFMRRSTKSSPAPASIAEQVAQNQCATQTFTSYNNATLALFQQNGVGPSVQQIIGERRLQEQFCAQFAKCVLVPNANSQLVSLEYAASFASCLKDEALEEYDAVARTGD